MATKFPFLVARTSILVAKNYIQELMEYNKLNVFYLALREKRMLSFLSKVFARGSITSPFSGKWARTQG